MKEWWPILAAKLRGHYQYYGVSGNMPSLQRYYRLAMRLALKWLNRRSQRRSFNWAGFNAYLKHYPLPIASHCSQPVHPIACNVSFTEEPDVGNPQVRFCEGH